MKQKTKEVGIASIKTIEKKCPGYDVIIGYETEIAKDGSRKRVPVLEHRDCGKTYSLIETTATDGTKTYKPIGGATNDRCGGCQTAHLTNIRVNKLLKDIELVGNMKNRISADVQQGILSVVGQAFEGLVNRFSGVKEASKMFDVSQL